MFEIAGKVALVTGGASGIGLESAKQFLANGAKGVAIADLNLQDGKFAELKLGEEFGKDRVIFIETDVGNKKSFEDAFEITLNAFKNIDILVNNAGIIEEANYEKTINVNLTGVITGIVLAMEKYIAKHKSGKEGVIVNVASIAGTQVLPAHPIYSATKSAVVNLTMTLGNEVHHEKTNIKIVAVAPGATDTKIFNKISFFNEFCKTLLEKASTTWTMQTSEFVVNNMMRIIREKPSGTVWIVQDGQEAFEYTAPTPSVKDN